MALSFAAGSVCFLVGPFPGYAFFGISAIASYVGPSSGSVLDLAAANWNTCLGAACFLAYTSKSRRARHHPHRGMAGRSGRRMLQRIRRQEACA